MRLRTLVPVTYNDGIAATKDGIVTMALGSVSYTNDFTEIGVNYTYFDADNKPINTNAFFLKTAAEINGLFNIIQPQLPPFVNEVDNTRWKFLYGARYQMAQTFGINVNQIEFYDETAE